MIWRWWNWCWWQYEICNTKKDFFTNALTTWFIGKELDLNEKDRPTTTEVSAKSVNQNNERWFEDDGTDAGDNMKYAKHKKEYFEICKKTKKEYFTNAVSARSLRNELDSNEKDRSTTTEVSAKSVNRNNEWRLKMIQLMLVTIWNMQNNKIGIFYHCCIRTIHTERTRLERERSTHYNRSFSQISESE